MNDLFKFLKDTYLERKGYTRQYLDEHDDIEDLIDQIIEGIYYQLTGQIYEGI